MSAQLLSGRVDTIEIVAVPSKSAFVDLGALGTPPGAPVSFAAALDLRLDLGGGVTLHLVRR